MVDLPPDTTLDALSGTWRIHQRQRGHRWSIDDLLTAHVACRAHPTPHTHLDLGCGIGSVLMLVAWKLRDLPCTHLGVEAQEASVALCRASLELNGITPRVSVRNLDFRDPAALAPEERFDLVTGTPPYVPLGTGALPKDPQRAACRIELRGGIEDYCRMAAAHLAPGGTVAVCGDGRRLDRTEKAAAAAGLHVHQVVELIPHPDKGPLFHVVVLRAEPAVQVTREALPARDPQGRRTREMQAVRAAFGMPGAADDADGGIPTSG